MSRSWTVIAAIWASLVVGLAGCAQTEGAKGRTFSNAALEEGMSSMPESASDADPTSPAATRRY